MNVGFLVLPDQGLVCQLADAQGFDGMAKLMDQHILPVSQYRGLRKGGGIQLHVAAQAQGRAYVRVSLYPELRQVVGVFFRIAVDGHIGSVLYHLRGNFRPLGQHEVNGLGSQLQGALLHLVVGLHHNAALGSRCV